MEVCSQRLLGVLLALGRLDSELRSLAGSSFEASKNHQTPVVDSMWCKHVSTRVWKEPLVPEEQMYVVAPEEASTCRSKGPKDEWIERAYDYASVSGSLKGKILQMEVVEDLESRPHKAVSFVV